MKIKDFLKQYTSIDVKTDPDDELGDKSISFQSSMNLHKTLSSIQSELCNPLEEQTDWPQKKLFTFES